MRIRVNFLILVLILLFPFFLTIATVAGLGFEINIYYFFAVSIFIALINYANFSFRQRTDEFFIRIMLILTLAIGISHGVELRFSMPLFFLVALLIFFGLSRIDVSDYDSRPILIFTLGYYLLSFLFLFPSSSYALMGRYSGFTGSSTTFSIYISALVILILADNYTKRTKIIVYLVGLFFVALTMTRLNLLFYLIIPVLHYVSMKSFKLKVLALIGFVVALNSVYPVYSILIEKYPSIIEFRYSEGRDPSFGLRYALHTTVSNAWSEGTVIEKLFGRGSEEARLLILKEYTRDILPHNDFIRIAYDFGLIPLILFSLAIFRITIRNRTTYLLGFLYMLSFYHNMVYNFFIITLMIVYYKIEEKSRDF